MKTRRQLCAEYRERYGWDMPTLKLARIIYNENKAFFPNVDGVRSALRAIEGKVGKQRSTIVKKIEERPKNPYNLPESDEHNLEPYRIKANRALILSDIHVPYHSVEGLTACFDWAKKEKPDTIILNGDTLDFYGLSRFEKDPHHRDFAYELSQFKAFMMALRKAFGGAKVYFKLGNHEVRYEKFLWQKAGELNGVEEFDIANLLKARAEGIEVIKDKTLIKLGGLNVMHGHEAGNQVISPVNIARGLYMKVKASAIQGHNHQSSEHTERDIDGKIVTCWSTGCLCELSPAYMPINRWNLGFAIVDVDGKDFEVRNKRIYRGKVY